MLLKEIIDKKPEKATKRGLIGIPMGLNMYELLPFGMLF